MSQRRAIGLLMVLAQLVGCTAAPHFRSVQVPAWGMGAGEEAKDVGQLAPGIGADLKVGQTVRIRTSSGSAYEGVVLAIDDALELAVKKSAVLEIGDNHAEKAKNLRISFAEIVSLEVGDPGMKPGEALFANIMLIGAVAVATFVALVLIYGGPGAN